MTPERPLKRTSATACLRVSQPKLAKQAYYFSPALLLYI
jgi:hypothetical protein